MRAAYLVKNGRADKAFEIREVPIADPSSQEVQIQVEGFGLNFADVMVRLGLYPGAPSKPTVLGCDVVGTITKVGSEVGKHLVIGDRVVALTRFGGYAEIVNADLQGVAKISDDIDIVSATALALQASTAYYMAHDMTNIHDGDHILIHAAAGGVGSILCQMAKAKGAVVYGTASTSDKLEFLKTIGVDRPINYSTDDFVNEVRKELSALEVNGLDIIFDPVGGNYVRKGLKLLRPGGRIILFGTASLSSAKNIFSKLGVIFGFGLYSPISLLNPSKSMLSVNMLQIADYNPKVLQRAIQGAVGLYNQGIINPEIGGVYSIDQLAEAHKALEKRKTMGKVAIRW